jgi:carboxyl-terminal processing protease
MLRIPGPLALLLLAACTSLPGLPEGAGGSSVTASAIERTRDLYLYPDRLDRRVMVGALDALEARFDSVRFHAEEGADHGVLSVGSESARVPLDAQIDPERFDSVLSSALLFVEMGLGDEVNKDESSNLELVALRGALSALDRYSTVFSGRGTEDFQIRFSGKLHGIGARIGRRDGHLIAVRVFQKSPANEAGLKDGDSILYIDGNATRPLTVGEAVGQIRGTAGTPVVLTVLRDEEQIDLEIIRGEVVVPSVEAKALSDGIGYARISTVSRSTLEEFRTKVGDLGPLSGLVLDLRGNTGGSMTAAANLADLFLESGLIVRIVDRRGDAPSPRGGRLAQPGILLGAQIVILVDPSTASAAEILSGALAPLARVTIVGQTTFGKGLIQRVMPLPKENLLKLTVGEYLLSDDRAIHERGVEPDILLFPVSPENLGRLADVPAGAIAYLRKQGEDDVFPIDFAQSILENGRRSALEAAHDETQAAIRTELEPFGVSWPGSAEPPEGLEPFSVATTAAPLVAGETGRVEIHIENPNDFDVADVWVALQGPALYLRNQLLALGTVPARGSVRGEIELVPSNGLSVDTLSVDVLVASGTHALQSERARLVLEHEPLHFEIEIARMGNNRVEVTLHNRGCCDPGAIRVAVPGAVRSFEKLPSGSSETAELPLTGGAELVTVIISGAGVQRRIEVPLPEDRVVVVPPELELQRASWLGRSRLEVHAQASEGLREGWLALDGQKEVYVAWDGRPAGLLRAELEGRGETANLTTKIETVSGVAVIDSRLIAD